MSSESAAGPSHLTYPAPEAPSTQTGDLASIRPVLTDRLFIGNLHPTVDEYALLQIFSKFGKVTKMDFLFHKTGLLKGKPRGYAFIEYADNSDAQKALEKANDKILRGRKLAVTFAHQAPLDSNMDYNGKYRKAVNDSGKPTTLSLIKSSATGRHKQDGTDSKIAQLEAKLRQMERSNPDGTTMAHPSLPAKPSPAFATNTSGSMRNLKQLTRPSVPVQSHTTPGPRQLGLEINPVKAATTQTSRVNERPKAMKTIIGVRRKPKPKVEKNDDSEKTEEITKNVGASQAA